MVSCSYPDQRVAPIFFGAEDEDGHRYGLLTYPFTATRRRTKNRPKAEHRFQIRFGDPERVRNEANPLGALRLLGRYPVVWGMTGALAAHNLAMHCLGSTWVLFMTLRFG